MFPLDLSEYQYFFTSLIRDFYAASRFLFYRDVKGHFKCLVLKLDNANIYVQVKKKHQIKYY